MIVNKEKIDKIKGFLDKREANCLYKLALEAGKKGPCLEIGSYCGKSSVYLGTACKENSTVLFRSIITAVLKNSSRGKNTLTPICWIKKQER